MAFPSRGGVVELSPLPSESLLIPSLSLSFPSPQQLTQLTAHSPSLSLYLYFTAVSLLWCALRDVRSHSRFSITRIILL